MGLKSPSWPAFLPNSSSARAKFWPNMRVPSISSRPRSPHPIRLPIELHSNYTVSGEKNVVDGLEPTDGAEHETIEITQGINNWFETGFYIFTSIHPGNGWEWVGDHIRPRVRAPESWHWPVGVSLSNEIGYQRPSFSADTWTWEIRPIVDKKIGRWYLSFNPTLDRSFHGPGVNQGVVLDRKGVV